jgi:hypothetical protein
MPDGAHQKVVVGKRKSGDQSPLKYRANTSGDQFIYQNLTGKSDGVPMPYKRRNVLPAQQNDAIIANLCLYIGHTKILCWCFLFSFNPLFRSFEFNFRD